MITIDVGRTATSHVADVMASMSLDGGGGGGLAPTSHHRNPSTYEYLRKSEKTILKTRKKLAKI